jgi:hypothetical protein
VHRAWDPQVFGLKASLPHFVANIRVSQFFKHTVTTDRDKVIIRFDAEATNFRNGDDDVRVTTITLIFGLDVTNRS